MLMSWMVRVGGGDWDGERDEDWKVDLCFSGRFRVRHFDDVY